MKLLFILFIFSQSVYALDTGNGSDGACNVTGGMDTQITSSRFTYQCKSLDIDADLNQFNGYNSGAAGNPLIIKVQGDVVIYNGVTIDLSGADGLAGDYTAFKIGGASGAGGSKGGDAPGFGLHGLDGSGDGAGRGGKYVTPFGTSSQGGGGGGGSYKTKAIDKGIDGDNAGITPSPGTGGVNGEVYGDEANFESVFSGGSGGAAGGAGINNNVPLNGSSGGGGGGAIHIIAGGNIDVNGWIKSRGGIGGGLNTTEFAGGGGAGSGGAIWLQAAGNIIVTSSGKITALGGAKGNNANGHYGGDGGIGRDRLDDSDGVIEINGSAVINPSAYTTSLASTSISTGTNAITRQYASGVSCASVTLDEPQKTYNNLLNLIFGISVVSLAYLILSKKSRV